MAIKAIINNTEKEIEQIKNSDEQDIDYVYSRIGDTEVEGELPISIKSIGGNLAGYRIYGNTVGGESVGDRTENLFDGFSVHGIVPSVSTGELTNSPSGGATTDFIAIDNGDITLLKSNAATSNMYIFLYAQDKSYIGYSQTTVADTLILYGNSINGYQNAKYARIRVDVESAYTQTNIMLNAGSTALPYEPYGYKVPVTVEGKNLLNSPLESYITSTGITVTVNADKSVTLNTENGTAADTYIYLYRNNTIPESLLNKPVILSGGTSTAPIRWWHYDGTNIITSANSDSNIFTPTQGAIDIFVCKNTVLNNVTVYPMIRKADIEDGTYEPYHAPVTTPIYLPEQIRKVGDEAEYVDYGAQKMHRVRKNLLKNTATNQTINGVTFTVNSDGSVTCNGTASSTAFFGITEPVDLSKNIISGCPKNGSSNSYLLRCQQSDGSYVEDKGNGVLIPDRGNSRAIIRINSGYTCTNLTFYPMVRKADISDDTYEPYIVNTEVNTNLPALSTIKGTNTLSVNTSIQPSNMYIKDNFDYKRIFTATRAIEDELPLNYRNIEDNDSTLDNYRIYGNTVGGESVGDLVESGEHAGEYKVPVTVSNGTDILTTPIYLTERIKKVGDEAEYIDYGEQKQHRVRKNLLPNKATSKTLSSGITITVNDNKSVVLNGTSNTGNAIGVILGGNVILDKGEYILTGCPQGGSNNTYKLYCIFDDDGERKVMADIGDGATIVLNGDNPKVVDNGFYIYALSCDNNVFFPMLRKADITDDTYEPYIENTDLDVTLPALPTLTGTNVLSVGTAVQPSEVYIKGKIKEAN